VDAHSDSQFFSWSACAHSQGRARSESENGRPRRIGQLIATAAGEGDQRAIIETIAAIAPSGQQQDIEPWQLSALSSLLNGLDRKHISLDSLAQHAGAGAADSLARLNNLLERARALAAAPDTKESLRNSAIGLLGRQPQKQEEDLRLLAGLLDLPVSARSQEITFAALRKIRGTQVPALLLDGWNKRGPAVRQGILATLLSREEWIPALLNSLEKGTIGSHELSTVDRQRLLKHANAEIRSRAATLWTTSSLGTRAEIVAKFKEAAMLPGDETRGSAVFAKNCATCHSLHGQGFSVGPNLAALADKPPADLLTAILDPNAAVEPRFVAYNIETKDGRSLSGIVNAETATTLTLIQSGGVQEKILRGDIEEIRASGLSLMPEGLEQAMSIQDLADTIAYLKTSPRQLGSATAEQTSAARKKFVATGGNVVGKIVHAFDLLPYPSWLGTLPMSYCRQTDGNSRIEWLSTPISNDVKPGTVVIFRLPVGMGFASNPPGTFQLSLNGKHLFDFDVALADRSWTSGDPKARMSYTVMEYNDEDSNGVLTIEVPAELLESGQPARFQVAGSARNSQRWFGIYQLPPG
jgi:putative heme-binding domain-containing protein